MEGFQLPSGKMLVLFFGTASHPWTVNELTPKMVKIYNNLIQDRDDVEFVSVCRDSTQKQVTAFTCKHPWVVLAADNPLRQSLIEQCEKVPTSFNMPRVVVINKGDRQIINMDATEAIFRTQDYSGKDFPWKATAAQNACAAATVCVFCSIL